MSFKKHAITAETPKNIPLGAGIVVKDLVYEGTKWNFTELGATNGGNKFSYEREYIDLQVDGKTVLVEGYDVKVAETGKITINLAGYERETIAVALSLKEDTTDAVTGFKKYKPSAENSYVDNLAFIGQTAAGKDVIVKFPKAFCKSAYEVEAKNKEQGTAFALEFDAVAPADAENFDELGIEIYFPVETV